MKPTICAHNDKNEEYKIQQMKNANSLSVTSM